MTEWRNNGVFENSTYTLKTYIDKVMLRMAGGVGVTALVAWLGYQSLINGGFMYNLLYGGAAIAWIPFIAEMAIAVALGSGLTRMSNTTANILFYVYAAITGVTFSVLPLAFGTATVFQAFVFAAAMFACCAIIGKFTNVDLSKFSGLFFGALMALILMSLLSSFVPVLQNGLIIGYVGIIVFLAITAWDMQRITSSFYQVPDGTVKENLATYAAFELYLDFINIFLYVLRIFGNSRSNN